jgi:RND superfamily putative drug exporter
MKRLAHFSFRHRRLVVAGWILAAVVVLAVSSTTGSKFNSNFNLPGTDSQAAISLLTKNFPAASGEGDQVVFQASRGATIRSPAVQTAVTAALDKVAKVPGINAVGSPYGKNGSAQISRDGTIAFATVTWSKVDAKITDGDALNLIHAAQSADGATLHVSVGGDAISTEEGGGLGLSVIVGVIGALLILLILVGGAFLPALMPLLTAGLALAIATSVISLLTHIMDVPSVSTDLAVLIGLGVGVDYGLFVLSRHRNGVKAGLSYETAAAQAVNTSGRTVLFAGITVCIALLGQFALGVNFLHGLSISSAVAVSLTMATSLTFLPAMLGFLGPKVLSRRERRVLTGGGPAPSEAGRFWMGWAKFVQARKHLVTIAALVVIVLIAVPITQLRLGSSDASTDPSGSTTHQAYTTLAKGFGPGFNGPLEVVGRLSSPADTARFEHLIHVVARTTGVASVTPAVVSPNGKVALSTLYPTTGPSSKQTVSLVNHLREQVIPASQSDSNLRVHVGGETATNIDFAHVLSTKLPLFIAVVVLLSFLLLMAVFRSLLIPLLASIMNLLSIAAALGALNAVFNLGWGASLLGQSTTGPIDAFIPVLMFSVLFGLSTDYEVYLVSRMQEEWQHLHPTRGHRLGTGDLAARHNDDAITNGLAKSGKIIAGAALIMVLVFGSFLLSGDRVLEEFGFGLAFAVLADAFLIRALLVPAIMHRIGPANWAMPRWLDRIVPNLSVEAAEEPADRPQADDGPPASADSDRPAGSPTPGKRARDGAVALTATALLAVSTLAALVATGATTSASAHATAASPTAPKVPKLTWKQCGGGYQCATAWVPLDYRHPNSTQIRLGMTRKLATDPAHRNAWLFINPGGPGGDTDAAVRTFGTSGPAQLRSRFNIIGVDPRGVGRSEPVACEPQAVYEQAWAQAASRTTTDSFHRSLVQGKQFADACGRASAKLLPYIGTENVARDMNLIRQAVGARKMNYFGISYGTYIGTVYANLFPKTVRVMALDGAYNPITYARHPYQYDTEQFVYADAALNRLFHWCGSNPKVCAFGNGHPRAAFVKLQHSLDANPVLGPNGRLVANGATLTFNTAFALDGGLAAWPVIAKELQAAQQHRSGELLLEALPAQGIAANASVECADRRFPKSETLLREELAKESADAPLTGPALAYAVPNYDQAHATACTQWSVRSQSRYLGPFDAPTAPPILVVGTTGDPDTPYPDAVSLAHILRRGRLLTFHGQGHTGYLNSKHCIINYETTYLVSKKLPPKGTVCRDGGRLP